MTLLVVLSVIDIALLIAGLAFYLFVVGGQLTRVAANLEECAGLVHTIGDHAAAIQPGLAHINRTGKIVNEALPLLYGMGEGIVAGVTPESVLRPEDRGPARPASGRRRSRMHDAVGYGPGPIPGHRPAASPSPSPGGS